MAQEQPITQTQGAQIIECSGVGHAWFSQKEETYEVLANINLKVPAGEFLSIVGPSGCGKSTLLRIMAGLVQPSEGAVRIGGQPVGDPRQDVGMVFQEPALFPWMTATDNVAFGSMISHVSKKIRRNSALDWLDKVGLDRFAKYYPHQLSGGMKQRVSLARALANGAQVLLMDEPFAALDYQARRQMQELLLRLWEQFQKTIVFVTHHIDEAVLLSDRVALFSSGPRATISDIVSITQPRPRKLQNPSLQQICSDIVAHVEDQDFNGKNTAR